MTFQGETTVGGIAERESLARSTAAPAPAPAQADLITRSHVLRLLRERLAVIERERLALEPSTPGGRTLVGAELAAEIAYRKAHNAARDDEAAWLRSTIAKLEAGRTVAALRELRDAIPTVTEATSCFIGEAG